MTLVEFAGFTFPVSRFVGIRTRYIHVCETFVDVVVDGLALLSERYETSREAKERQRDFLSQLEAA